MKYVAGRNPRSGLLGKTEFEKAQIDQWTDYINFDAMKELFPIVGCVNLLFLY